MTRITRADVQAAAEGVQAKTDGWQTMLEKTAGEHGYPFDRAVPWRTLDAPGVALAVESFAARARTCASRTATHELSFWWDLLPDGDRLTVRGGCNLCGTRWQVESPIPAGPVRLEHAIVVVLLRRVDAHRNNFGDYPRHDLGGYARPCQHLDDFLRPLTSEQEAIYALEILALDK